MMKQWEANVIQLSQEDIDFLKARELQDEAIRAAGGVPGRILNVFPTAEQLKEMCDGKSPYTNLYS